LEVKITQLGQDQWREHSVLRTSFVLLMEQRFLLLPYQRSLWLLKHGLATTIL